MTNFSNVHANLLLLVGDDMALVVIPRPFTAEARVQSLFSMGGSCFA